MVRRSTPQKKIDDRAFPVRIRAYVPALGRSPSYVEVHAWLKDNLGTGNYASHGERGYLRDINLYYFRTAEVASRFLAAFPALELADETQSPEYTSPARAAGLG